MQLVNGVADFRCEQCGSTSFEEMWHCRMREAGSCPYQSLKHSPQRFAAGLFVTAFGLTFVVAGIFFTAYMGSRYTSGVLSAAFLVFFLLVFVGFGAFASFFGLYLAFGQSRALYDERRGRVLQQSALTGFTLARRMVLRLAKTNPPAIGQFAYPVSIIALDETPSWQELKGKIKSFKGLPAETQTEALKDINGSRYGRDLLLAVILDLAGREQIAIERAQSSTARFSSTTWKQDEHLFLTPGPHLDVASAGGELEKRVLFLVRDWKTRPEAVEDPVGPTGRLLVRTLIESDVATPGSKIAEIAWQDAISRGLAQKNSRWFNSFRFADHVRAATNEEHAKLEAKLKQLQSDLLIARLAKDIHDGIRSRESSD
jgi:hypothetical protein